MESSQGVDAGVGSGTETACTRFNEALDLAAITYSDFADVTAGDQWEYRDPVVHDANITSRTALRTAAATALGASATEGLHPDVAAQMRGWSLGAGKLVVLMGLHINGDAINRAVVDLNGDTNGVQLACARKLGPT